MTAVFVGICTQVRHLRYIFAHGLDAREENAASFNSPGNVFDGQKQLAAFSERLILGTP